MKFDASLKGHRDHKPDKRGPKPSRENRNLAGMPSKHDLDPKGSRSNVVGRVGHRKREGF